MKELFFRKGGQKTAYEYRNLRMEKSVGFLKILSYESDAFEGRHEMMERGNAVVVLPVDFLKREIYLIEQPRHLRGFAETEEGRAIFDRARQGGWTKSEDRVTLPREAVATFEAPAGIIDPGETAETAAVRELCEETGLIVEESDLERIASYYPSVGGALERITAFFAKLPENGTMRRVEALSDEDIDLVTVWKLGFDDAFALLGDGTIVTASSHIILRELYIRDRLRERAARDSVVRLG